MTIKFYKINEPYGYMSNYKKAPIYLFNNWFKWVESAYQFCKTTDPEEQLLILNAKTNNEARLLGQKVILRSDWNDIKISVMKECVLAKFLQHKDLADQLIYTGNEEIQEDSLTDFFWAIGDGTGQNHLGKILMEVREILKQRP